MRWVWAAMIGIVGDDHQGQAAFLVQLQQQIA